MIPNSVFGLGLLLRAGFNAGLRVAGDGRRNGSTAFAFIGTILSSSGAVAAAARTHD